jgi:hypothetical protein
MNLSRGRARTMRKLYQTGPSPEWISNLIERVYNALRRHATTRHVSPIEFGREISLTGRPLDRQQLSRYRTGSRGAGGCDLAKLHH